MTLVVGQKKDLLHDKQFLQEEVIGKLDNMLEYMERFSKDIITLLESNQSLRNVVGILSSSLYVLLMILFHIITYPITTIITR